MNNQIFKKIILASIVYPLFGYAASYDLSSSVKVSYDQVCDNTYGCYEKVISDDSVLKSKTVSYVLGQDADGKALTLYNEEQIDEKPTTLQVTSYTPTQRLLKNETYYNASKNPVASKEYTYDAYMRVVKETLKSYDDNGVLYQTNYLKHMYDSWNIDKEKQVVLTSSVSGEYKSYLKSYDLLGRLSSLSYKLNGKSVVSNFEYDGSDRLAMSVDFNQNITTKLYDNDGYLYQTISQGNYTGTMLGSTEDTERSDYEYDNYGRMKNSQMNNEYSEAYTYDASGLTKVVSMGLSSNLQPQNFLYDNYNRVISYTDNNDIKYELEYDPDGDLKSVSVSSDMVNGEKTTKKYGYGDDVAYWLQGRIYELSGSLQLNGHTQSKTDTIEYYSPDEATYAIEIGMPKSKHFVIKQDGAVIQDMTIATKYDDQARIINETYSSKDGDNNINKDISYTYDPLNRLEVSKTVFKGNAGVKSETINYEYNINGDIEKVVQVVVNQDGSSTTTTNVYNYNEIDQLISRDETITVS